MQRTATFEADIKQIEDEQHAKLAFHGKAIERTKQLLMTVKACAPQLLPSSDTSVMLRDDNARPILSIACTNGRRMNDGREEVRLIQQEAENGTLLWCVYSSRAVPGTWRLHPVTGSEQFYNELEQAIPAFVARREGLLTSQ